MKNKFILTLVGLASLFPLCKSSAQSTDSLPVVVDNRVGSATFHQVSDMTDFWSSNATAIGIALTANGFTSGGSGSGSSSAVTSVNGRTGPITLAIADLSDATTFGKSWLGATNAAAAQILLGITLPSAASAPTGDFVTGYNPSTGQWTYGAPAFPVTTVNGRTGSVTTATADITDAGTVGQNVLKAANQTASDAALGLGSAAHASASSFLPNSTLPVTFLPPSAVRNYNIEATVIDSLISGLTASTATTQPLYSAANDSNHTYTRNPALWLPSSYDMTAVSVASTSGWTVTAITPYEGITAWHTTLASGTGSQTTGDSIWFVTNASATVPPVTITNITRVGTTDIAIVSWNTALPGTIKPATVLPTSLPSGYTFAGAPLVYMRSDRNLYIADAQSIQSSGNDTVVSPGESNRVAWGYSPSPAVSGDSSRPVFILLDNQPVYLFSFYTGANSGVPTPGAGPDVGANAAAVNALLGGGRVLAYANLPTPPGSGVSLTSATPSTLTISGASPNYTLSVAASTPLTINTSNIRTANYTAVPGELVLADCSAGSFTITLPPYPTVIPNVGILVVNSNEAAGYSIAVNASASSMGPGAPTTLKTAGSGEVYQWHVNENWYPVAQIGSQVLNDGRYALSTNPTANKTATYPAVAGDRVMVDTSTGSVPITLPNAPPDKTPVSVKIIKILAGNSCTITTQGSDVFNVAGGSTSITLAGLYQGVNFVYEAQTHTWIEDSSDLPKSYTDSLYETPAQVTAALAGYIPTSAIGSGVMAFSYLPPTNWLGTGNGQAASATDSRFTLAGTVNGVTVSGTPTAGMVLMANSSGTAIWGTPSSGSGYTGVATESGAYTFASGDSGKVLVFNGSGETATLGSGLASGWNETVKNLGPGVVTISPGSPAQVDGGTSGSPSTVPAYTQETIVSDGSNTYRTVNAGPTSNVPQALFYGSPASATGPMSPRAILATDLPATAAQFATAAQGASAATAVQPGTSPNFLTAVALNNSTTAATTAYTDSAVAVLKLATEPITVTSTQTTATITPNITSHGRTIINVPLTQNTTIANPTGITLNDTDQLEIRFFQNSTGGYLVTWGTSYDFTNNTPATSVPTGANQKSQFDFNYFVYDSLEHFSGGQGPYLQ